MSEYYTEMWYMSLEYSLILEKLKFYCHNIKKFGGSILEFKAECRSTAIGSFPHKTAEDALNMIFSYLKDIPVWPQLPSGNFLEGMGPQYSEGVPAITLDTKAEKIFADTGDNLPTAMEKFYEQYMSEDTAPLAISEKFAAGLYKFPRLLPGSPAAGCYAVKGHTTGPITWGLTVCDAAKKASYYNDMLKDGVIKALARKVEWQIDFLKPLNDKVIIFIDEPYLQSYGSATVPLTEDDVTATLNEIILSVKNKNAISGIHCCGNTDWSLLCKTNTDIVNFDAFEYSESLSLYINEVSAFLERGGILAWGVVPSTPVVDSQDINTITEAFRSGVALLTKKGIKESTILEQSLITPSCGGGSLTVPQCEKMLSLTAGLSEVLRG